MVEPAAGDLDNPPKKFRGKNDCCRVAVFRISDGILVFI